MKKMRVVTLCGSTKFRAEFERVMMEETLRGHVVISVGMFGHEIGLDMASDTKRMLDRMHFQKIDMADEIYVINPGGYVGLSTCDKIHYAKATGKPVRWLEEPDGWVVHSYSAKHLEESMSDIWDTEELACYALGKTDEETETIIDEPGKIDELLIAEYDIDLDTYHRIVMDLLPFTPKVKTALAGNYVHAFVRTDKHGPCTIVRMDANQPINNDNQE